MQFLTDFADQAVILPALCLACFALIAIGWRQAALALAGSALAVSGVVAVGKMSLIACPALTANPWGLRSPSGHTAMAALLYGGLIALMIASRRRVWSALSCAVTVAATVGVSRLVLGAHSLADVMVGCLIGAAGACAMVVTAGPRPSRPAHHRLVVVAALSLALLLFHGQHLPAEAALGAYARLLFPPQLCQADAEAGVHGPGADALHAER